MAEKRTYEVVVIIDPKTTEDDTTNLINTLVQTIEKQGGAIVKSEDMGRRRLAYEIDHKTEAHYWLFEIDGSGSEIAELERRMRVSDLVVRYLTVRVDLDRRRAAKFKAKRTRRAERKRNSAPARRQQQQQQQPEFEMEEAAAIES
ncbi:MAG: 30S ribosomal protein S6 [Pyrinomonadaceae bacterium]